MKSSLEILFKVAITRIKNKLECNFTMMYISYLPMLLICTAPTRFMTIALAHRNAKASNGSIIRNIYCT